MVAPDDGQCPSKPMFDFQVRAGMIFIVQAACVSALAVLGLLVYIGYSASRNSRSASRHWSTQTHVHWYFLSLLVSELIQAAGGIMNAKWIADAAVEEGLLCSTQGALKQLGDVGVALASLAIAIHTFCVLVLKWRPSSSPKIAILTICIIWLFLALLISISFATHKGKDYYGDTQYWCWITSSYPVQRIVLEYFWMWLTGLLNILLYVPMALVIKRIIDVDGWRVCFLDKRQRGRMTSSGMPGGIGKEASDIAMRMLFYPAIYTCTVLPIAIVRWQAFLGHCIPWPATVAADVIFASSGLLNVLLFTITRPTLRPRREHGTHSRAYSDFSGPPLSHSHRATPSVTLDELSILRAPYSAPRNLWFSDDSDDALPMHNVQHVLVPSPTVSKNSPISPVRLVRRS